MKNQGLINEIFWLRSMACLAVTFGHAINNGYFIYDEVTIYRSGLYVIHMAVLFGVPVFVFISELLLANKYLLKVPKGFMKKRIKILIFPYLFMSIVYALLNLESWTSNGIILGIVGSVFLGKSSVYFILIIFQFYFLHMLLSKYLNQLSAKVVISIAFFLNVCYLAFFNFIAPPENVIGKYVWETGYWIPFMGWIFYFVLGFYFGRNYQSILLLLQKRWVLLMPILTLMLMLIVNKYFLFTYDSKRVDMLLYASSVIFFIMYVSTQIRRVPKLVMFFSNYSFSIFLLNMFFFKIFRFVEPPEFLNIITYTVIVFLLTLFLCIGTAFVCNQFKWGMYFVGRIMPFKVNDTENPLFKNSTAGGIK